MSNRTERVMDKHTRYLEFIAQEIVKLNLKTCGLAQWLRYKYPDDQDLIELINQFPQSSFLIPQSEPEEDADGHGHGNQTGRGSTSNVSRSKAMQDRREQNADSEDEKNINLKFPGGDTASFVHRFILISKRKKADLENENINNSGLTVPENTGIQQQNEESAGKGQGKVTKMEDAEGGDGLGHGNRSTDGGYPSNVSVSNARVEQREPEAKSEDGHNAGVNKTSSTEKRDDEFDKTSVFCSENGSWSSSCDSEGTRSRYMNSYGEHYLARRSSSNERSDLFSSSSSWDTDKEDIESRYMNLYGRRSPSNERFSTSLISESDGKNNINLTFPGGGGDTGSFGSSVHFDFEEEKVGAENENFINNSGPTVPGDVTENEEQRQIDSEADCDSNAWQQNKGSAETGVHSGENTGTGQQNGRNAGEEQGKVANANMNKSVKTKVGDGTKSRAENRETPDFGNEIQQGSGEEEGRKPTRNNGQKKAVGNSETTSDRTAKIKPKPCYVKLTKMSQDFINKHKEAGKSRIKKRRGPKKSNLRTECNYCHKEFTCHFNLFCHERIHTGEKPFVCKICGKCFRLKCNLKTHLVIHTGEKPYSCKTCGKSFRLKCNLKTHLVIHTGEKPYSCKNCGNCFSRKSNLKDHARIHKGEKPFSCKNCGKCFSQKSTLKTHVQIHTGEKPYSCKICGKCFTLKTTLNVHFRIHSGEKPYTCSDCGMSFAQPATHIRHIKYHCHASTKVSKKLK